MLQIFISIPLEILIDCNYYFITSIIDINAAKNIDIILIDFENVGQQLNICVDIVYLHLYLFHIHVGDHIALMAEYIIYIIWVEVSFISLICELIWPGEMDDGMVILFYINLHVYDVQRAIVLLTRTH